MIWPYHPDLLARPVPRYTSFPTAAEFGEDAGAAGQEAALRAVTGDVSLYVHIPFCEKICWYCGCNTGAAGHARRLGVYLATLEQEIDAVAARLPPGARVERIAFGGGSPNAIAPLDFVRLVDRLLLAFRTDSPLISIELDPRSFTEGWARVLGAVGVGCASLGVQTLDPAVQARIGRVQDAALIARTVDLLRGAGVRSLNFDLMYGLPGQTVAVLAETLDGVLAMRPERIALFGYAHVPHLIPRQRQIDGTDLPDPATRFRMAADGHERLCAGGYVPIGFDHFALPHDPMARAAEGGALRRNFQGFTDDQAETLIGLGASAISQFPGLLVQNEKNAGRWRALVESGSMTGVRGVVRTSDDRLRGLTIEDLLSHRPADVSPWWDADLARAVGPFVARGLIRIEGQEWRPVEATRPYARSIAALLDPYRAGAPHRFSTAI